MEHTCVGYYSSSPGAMSLAEAFKNRNESLGRTRSPPAAEFLPAAVVVSCELFSVKRGFTYWPLAGKLALE